MQSQITYPEWDHWRALVRWKFSEWPVLLAGIEPSSDAGQLIQPVEFVIEGSESEPTGVYVPAVCDGPLRLYAEHSADIATRGAQAITAGDLDVLELGDADNVVSLRRDVLVWANQQHIVIPDDLIELGEAEPDWGYYRGVDALPLEEGLFLLVRIGRGEHKVIRRSSSGGFVSPERMAAYRMYRDWAHASILAGGLRAQSIPQKSSRGDSVSYWITVPDLIAWAEAKGIPAPDELRLATTPSSQTALTHQAGEPRRGVHWEEKRAAVLEVALYRLANDLDGSCRDKSGRVVASRLAALVDEHRLFDGLARETPTVRTIAEHIRRALREPESPELGEKKTD